jgi:hypothetical protein
MICAVAAEDFLSSWTSLASKDAPRGDECDDTTLIFLEYEIVAMGRRSMNADVAVMHQYRSYPRYLRYNL